MKPKLFIANKGLILHNGKALVIRESSKYKDGTNEGRYGLVGGRLDPGENFQDSLRREVKEEVGLSIRIGKPFYVSEWRPIVRGERWQIVGIFFECHAETDAVQLSEDHDHYKWIDPKTYKEQNLIPNLHAVFEAFLEGGTRGI